MSLIGCLRIQEISRFARNDSDGIQFRFTFLFIYLESFIAFF